MPGYVAAVQRRHPHHLSAAVSFAASQHLFPPVGDQRLLDLAERLETIEAVREGLASIERSEGRPMDEVFDELEKTLRTRAKP